MRERTTRWNALNAATAGNATSKPIADSTASFDVKLDAAGGFLACALSGQEVVRVEAVPEAATPWGETVRPRAGAIGWHVIRIGGRKR